MQENIPQTFGSSTIISILICIRGTQWIGSNIDNIGPDLQNGTVFRNLRNRLGKTVLSLQYIALTFAAKGENPFNDSHRVPLWWSVDGSHARKLEAVPLETAERLREQLLKTF